MECHLSAQPKILASFVLVLSHKTSCFHVTLEQFFWQVMVHLEAPASDCREATILVRKRTQLKWKDLILLSYAFCLICMAYIEHVTSLPSTLGSLTVKWVNGCFTHKIVDKNWAKYCHQAFIWEEPSALKHQLQLLAMLIYSKWENLPVNDSRTRWQPDCNTGLYRRIQNGTWNPLPSNILINSALLAQKKSHSRVELTLKWEIQFMARHVPSMFGNCTCSSAILKSLHPFLIIPYPWTCLHPTNTLRMSWFLQTRETVPFEYELTLLYSLIKE